MLCASCLPAIQLFHVVDSAAGIAVSGGVVRYAQGPLCQFSICECQKVGPEAQQLPLHVRASPPEWLRPAWDATHLLSCAASQTGLSHYGDLCAPKRSLSRVDIIVDVHTFLFCVYCFACTKSLLTYF